MLTEYMLARGRSRIGFINGPRDLTVSQDRLAGYRKAMEHAGLKYDPTLVEETDFGESGGRSAARRLLTDHWSWLATGPAGRTRTSPAALDLTQRDFNDFWGTTRRVPLTPPTPFQITLTPLTSRHLTVSPPADFDGTVNDWLYGDTLPLGMYDVLKSPADIPQAA